MTKQEYILACYTIKGHFIESVTLLEYQLSFIIAHIKEKHEESTLEPADLHHKIHKKILSEKLRLFQELINKYCPDFIIKKKGLFTRLHEIKNFRNEITHSLLDISREKFNYTDGMNKAIYFASIKSNPINNVPNCPSTYILLETISSNIDIIDNVCLALREFLKNEFGDHSL